jgi:uncharacterized protein
MRFVASEGIMCVFVKEPRPGRVKTRLAASLGPRQAATLAEAFLADTLETVRALPSSRRIAAVEPTDYEPPSAIERWPQGEGDLGDRIERIARRALRDAPWLLVVGTDSPGMPRRLLARAIERLAVEDGPDAVVGPCDDGGYYALGLRRPFALSDVRWSTRHACSDTEAAIVRAGLRSERLEPWFDVDEPADLWRLEAMIERGAVLAPATERALRRLRADHGE